MIESPQSISNRWLRGRGWVLALALLASPLVARATSHGDQTINGLEVWTASDSPHLVTGTINVEKGGRLVLEPGAIVYFSPDYHSGIVIRGSLTANGASDARIFLGTATAHQVLQSPLSDLPLSWPPSYWRGTNFKTAPKPPSSIT